MYKVCILGCENTHADAFMKAVITDKFAEEIEFVGVYSDEEAAMQKLNEKYGVYMMKSYDEMVGKVDGIIVTARHGDNHYKYAKPYMESGIPMFIDKPVTCSEGDALALKADLIKNNIKVFGGSSVPLSEQITEIKEAINSGEFGKIRGGYAVCPVSLVNSYGGFFFYSQHLAQVVCEVFGYSPESVQVIKTETVLTCVIRYQDFDVTVQYPDKADLYYAVAMLEKKMVGGPIGLAGCYEKEFAEFYNVLKGGDMKMSYDELIAPVFLLNAINRSMESGKEEKVTKIGE